MSKKTKQAAAPIAPTGAVEGAAATDTQEVVAGPDAPAAAGLLGSSVQPPNFTIGGREFTLGDIVRAAHVATGLSVDEWNALAADVREGLIADELSALEADAAQADADQAAAEAKAKADADQEAADAEAKAAADAAASKAATYPRQITLRNNSGFDATEPATRMFVGAGASVHAMVHDEAQAVSLLQNIRAIEQRTNGRQRLLVIGLDDVATPEETGDAQ